MKAPLDVIRESCTEKSESEIPVATYALEMQQQLKAMSDLTNVEGSTEAEDSIMIIVQGTGCLGQAIKCYSSTSMSLKSIKSPMAWILQGFEKN